MAKARIYGMFSSYIPNNRADMRFRKKVYQHNREVAERFQGQKDEKRMEDMKKGNRCEKCV